MSKKSKKMYEHPDLEALFDGVFPEDRQGNRSDSFRHESAILKPKTGLGYSLICLLVVTVLAVLYVIAINLNTAHMTISMTFSEISKGCNPDGSPFDIYELMSTDVLELASEKLDGAVDAETLSKHITVTGVTSDGSFNAIQKNVLDGNDTYSYFPSRYTLRYSVVSDAVKSEGQKAQISAVINQFRLPSKEKILKAVADSYKEYYEDKYVISDGFFDINWDKTRSLDHFNRVTEMSNILNRFSRYLSARYDEDVRYVAEDKTSFGDLDYEASRILENDVEAYKAYVIQKGITTDRERLLRQLEYVKKSHEEQYNRSIGEYNAAMEGLALYDAHVTKVVFIPALDAENKFYMNRTKIGVDYLTEYADRARLTANQEENEVKYYEYLLRQFGDASTDTTVLKNADDRCEEIIVKITALADRARIVNREYIRDNSYEEVVLGKISGGHGIVDSAIALAKNVLLLICALYTVGWFISAVRYIKKRINGADDEDREENNGEEVTGRVGQ